MSIIFIIFLQKEVYSVEMQDKFSENLKRLMDVNKTSPTELAKFVHVDRQTIYKWLAGGGVSESRKQKLADYFGITTAELTYGTGTVSKDLLREILIKIQASEDKAGVTLDIKKKAALTALLYERSLHERKPNDAEIADLVALSA